MYLRLKYVRKSKKETFNPDSDYVDRSVKEFLLNGNKIIRLDPVKSGSNLSSIDSADNFLREEIWKTIA